MAGGGRGLLVLAPLLRQAGRDQPLESVFVFGLIWFAPLLGMPSLECLKYTLFGFLERQVDIKLILSTKNNHPQIVT